MKTRKFIAESLLVHSRTFGGALMLKGRWADRGGDGATEYQSLFDDGRTELVAGGKPVDRAGLLEWFARTWSVVATLDVDPDRYGLVTRASFEGSPSNPEPA